MMHSHDGHGHDHGHPHEHPHPMEDNSHAGQGSVILDIGDGVGALVVTMPAELLGVEVEICPSGEERSAAPREHVAVVSRPTPVGDLPPLVFGAVPAGRHELYRKDGGPTVLIVDVHDACVTEVDWPAR